MKSSMPEGLFFQRCMTLGSRYTEWSLQKVPHLPPPTRVPPLFCWGLIVVVGVDRLQMADMEQQLLERKRETGEQPDEAEEQEGKGKEKMDQ
jgi:hypothetical protein